MIRLFLKYYLVICLPLLFLFIPAWNPVMLLIDRWGSAFYAEEFGGVFYLIEKDLDGIPLDEWPSRIDAIAGHFGTRLTLIDEDKAPLGFFKRRALDRGAIVFKPGRISRLFHEVSSSGKVLALSLEPENEVVDQYLIQGPVYLLDRLLEKQPVARWQALVMPETIHSETPVTLVRTDHLPPLVRSNPRLPKREMVEEELEPHLYNLYVASPNPDWIYRFGPVDERGFRAKVANAQRLVPAVLLALGILLLSWPLWRDIHRLRRTANSFAQGRLDQRVRLGKGSSLAPLAKVFNHMGASLRQLLDSQKQLSNAVSHEIRTPLARIRFAAEMLGGSPLDEDGRRFLHNIEEDVGEVESLVDGVLKLARYDRSVAREVLKPRDLLPLAQAVAERFGTHWPELVLETDFASQQLIGFEFEPQGMKILLDNLLRNAARHARSRVRFRIEWSAQEVTIRVEDDGDGIAEADRERIFQPFVRLDESRQRATGGMGLGLSIVQRIVDWHGGSVQCRVSQMGGAAFVVVFPTHQHDREKSE